MSPAALQGASPAQSLALKEGADDVDDKHTSPVLSTPAAAPGGATSHVRMMLKPKTETLNHEPYTLNPKS